MRHTYVTEGQCVCDCFVTINPLMPSFSNFTQAPEYSAECFLFLPVLECSMVGRVYLDGKEML